MVYVVRGLPFHFEHGIVARHGLPRRADDGITERPGGLFGYVAGEKLIADAHLRPFFQTPDPDTLRYRDGRAKFQPVLARLPLLKLPLDPDDSCGGTFPDQLGREGSSRADLEKPDLTWSGR